MVLSIGLVKKLKKLLFSYLRILDNYVIMVQVDLFSANLYYEVFDMDIMVIIWLSLFVCFVILEAASVQLVGIWFAIFSLVSLALALFGVPEWVQLVVFIVGSTFLLIITRPFAKRFMKGSQTKTNADRVIGTEAVVIHEINNDTAEGQVKVLGQVWSARSQAGEVIPVDAKVIVRSIEGVKVMVENKEEQ